MRSLVYAMSALAGAALGALAGTSGVPSRTSWGLAPLVVLTLLRRKAWSRAAGLSVLVAILTWSLAGLHEDGSREVRELARAVPSCDAKGEIQERLGDSGVVLALSARCGDVTTRGGRVYARLDAPPGTSVRGTGWLLPVGRRVGFDEMLERTGLPAIFEFRDVRLDPPGGAYAAAESFRSQLRSSLSNDARGELALGLTIGETGRLSPSDVNDLRAAGLSHLVAVSGSNVAIVLGALGLAFSWTSRRARLTVAVVGLAAFVLVVGPEPSVLRAAAMGGIALAAVASGTRADPLTALMLALTILLILRPALVWSVGLHLSAAATAGIVLWSGRIERAFRRLPAVVRLPLAVTLAAQLAVTPVLLVSFGSISLVAPMSNVLAAPAVAPATILALVAGCLHPLAPALASVPAAVAELTCGWILAVGRTLGATEWAEVSLPPGRLLVPAVFVLLVLVVARPSD